DPKRPAPSAEGGAVLPPPRRARGPRPPLNLPQHAPVHRRPDAAARIATPPLTRIPMPDSAFPARPAATGHRRRRPPVDATTLYLARRAVALPLRSEEHTAELHSRE